MDSLTSTYLRNLTKLIVEDMKGRHTWESKQCPEYDKAEKMLGYVVAIAAKIGDKTPVQEVCEELLGCDPDSRA